MNTKRKDAIHRVSNIARVITIYIVIAYAGLSAQSKGFTDTVILKNGTVLSGVKATVTKESLVVTTPEGETSVFTKKEVSEVKKGDAGNSTNVTKPDPKPTPSSGNFSRHQGAMNWNDAKAKCASLNMRLPTRDELVAAYKAGVWEKWQKEVKHEYSFYWTSEDYYTMSAYSVNMLNGDVGNVDLDNYYTYVRCIR